MNRARNSTNMSARKSTTSQTTKKVERQDHLDFAIFRFAVDPETLPINSRSEHHNNERATNQSLSPSTVKPTEGALMTQMTTSDLGKTGGKDSVVPDAAASFPSVRIVQEGMFVKMMAERAASRQWRATECIQAGVKAQKGLGKHIPINFTMQLDYSEQRHLKLNKEKDTALMNAKTLGLNYDYQSIGQEYRKEIQEETSKSVTNQLSSFKIDQLVEQKLKVLRPKDFCQRQVLKMCYYLQKLHELEILQLNCDFFQDDNGEVWFFHARDILVRPKMKSQVERNQEEDIIRQQRLLIEKREELRQLERADWKNQRREKKENQKNNIFKPLKIELKGRDDKRKQFNIKKQAQMQRIEQLSMQMGLIVQTTEGSELSFGVDAEGGATASQRDVAIKKYSKQLTKFFMKQNRLKTGEMILEDTSCSERDEGEAAKTDLIQQDRERLARNPEKREVHTSVGSTRRTHWSMHPREPSKKPRDGSQRTLRVKLVPRRGLGTEQSPAKDYHQNFGNYPNIADPQVAMKLFRSQMRNLRYERGNNQAQLFQSRQQMLPKNELIGRVKAEAISQRSQHQMVGTIYCQKQIGTRKDPLLQSNVMMNGSLDQYKLHSTARTFIQSIEDSSRSSIVYPVQKGKNLTDKSYFNTVGQQPLSGLSNFEQIAAQKHQLQALQPSQAQPSSFLSSSQRQMGLKNKNFSVLNKYAQKKQAEKGGGAGTGPPLQTLTYGFASSDETLDAANSTQVSPERIPLEQQPNLSTIEQHRQNQSQLSANRPVTLVGPMQRNFSVQQVSKAAAGERIFLINKGHSINVHDAASEEPIHLMEQPSQFESVRPPQTAEPLERVRVTIDLGRERQTSTFMEGESSGQRTPFTHSELQVPQLGSRAGRQTAIATAQDISEPTQTDAYFNLFDNSHSSKQKRKNNLYQLNKPKAQRYLRSIDRNSQEEPSFFHLPEPKKVQRTGNLNFAKVRSRTQQRQQASVREDWLGACMNSSIGMSGRQQPSKAIATSRQDILVHETEIEARRHTLVSKFQQVKKSSVATLSTEQASSVPFSQNQELI